MMSLQSTTLITIGVLLLALVTVESGGYFLTKVVRGTAPANALQVSFYRAGHAHAAVLLVLSIAILLATDGIGLTGFWELLGRYGVPVAAILMPAGFFLSVGGKDPARPNRLISLLWVGVLCLTAALICAGIALIVAGASA